MYAINLMTEEASRLDDILALAECLARLGGYKNFSIQSVADRTGLKPSSIYQLFPTKEQLAVAVVRRFGERVKEHIGRPDDPAVPAQVKLDTLIDVYRQSITDDGQLCLFLVFGAELHTLPASVQTEVRQFFQGVFKWLETVLRRFPEYGPDSGRDAAKAARAIIASLNGSQICVRAAGDRAVFDEVVVQLHASGLVPQRSSSSA